MSQKLMIEAGIQVEAGLELREMLRPVFLKVARGARTLYAKASASAAAPRHAAVAHGALEGHIAPAHKA